MTTQFTFAEIPLFDALSFYIDGNSKITAGNGSYDEPAPNAFSLPHIATCPGSTERCRASCYVHGLKQNAPHVYRHYEMNELALHSVLMTDGRAERAANAVASWIEDNARGGFRWHVSGDVFSVRHATWIVEVARRCGHHKLSFEELVPMWIYTRTLDVVSILTRAPGLAVNISADRHNWTRAVETARRHPSARLCYLVSEPDEQIPTLPPGSVIFPDYPLRGRSLPEPTDAPWWQGLTIEQRRQVCPADFFGQSEQHRCGPCRKCLVPS